MKKIIILLFLFVISQYSRAYERSDAFVITSYSSKFSVKAPVKFKPRVNVIVVNKTLIKLLGKIENKSGKVLQYISVDSGASQSVEIGHKLNEKIHFMPISPGFQKVDLIIGSKPYEIPPKE